MKIKEVLQAAISYSYQSDCLTKKVGAVLIHKDALIGSTKIQVPIDGAFGFSGSVHKCEVCLRKTTIWTQDGCWSIHAEVKALLSFFEKFGFKKDLSKYVMLSTHGPCDQCIKYMEFFKVKKCIYLIPYKTDYSKWNGLIKIEKYKGDLDGINLSQLQD